MRRITGKFMLMSSTVGKEEAQSPEIWLVLELLSQSMSLLLQPRYLHHENINEFYGQSHTVEEEQFLNKMGLVNKIR